MVSISGEAQANISRILSDVRRESETASPPLVRDSSHHYQGEQQSRSSDQGPSSSVGASSNISWGSEGACGEGGPSGRGPSGYGYTSGMTRTLRQVCILSLLVRWNLSIRAPLKLKITCDIPLVFEFSQLILTL